ncbi:MAG: D-aminoacylase [Pirellulales bacterium]|nr:D-aminoacylase [Pirellulales bacterium]
MIKFSFPVLRSVCVLAVAVVVLLVPVALGGEPEIKADVLLRGGSVLDGSGGEATVADVAIRKGKIVAVGKLDATSAGRVIDCSGMIVAPGFIDLHTHCDPVGPLAMRRNLNYLRQGCTTVVSGNCGDGTMDIAAYFARLEREGAGTNVILLVPHGSVRARAMGGDNRPPTASELQRMQALVERGMREGAWGISTGLIYPPGMFAQADELVALAKVVARHDGLYVSHIRNEADGLLGALQEAIQIGREAGLPVHISHLKAVGPANWGSLRKAASMIEKARAEGLTVTADQYPYIATSTNLAAVLLPATELPGGLKDFNRRMRDDAEYQQAVRRLVLRRMKDNPRIVIASCDKHPEWNGKSLDDIAAQLKTDVAGAALAVQMDGGASVVRFVLSEDDVRLGMTFPWVATGSDGNTHVPQPGIRPHPRSFGTFPRKIGFYARREKVLNLAQAVRSATGLPADIVKLTDRGYLRAGYVADIVVFDPEAFVDRATFEDPQQYSPGVRWLFLAGQSAVTDGQVAESLYGHPLRHPSVPENTP